MKSKNLYLFDFDGTLTVKDSMFDFLKFIAPVLFYIGFVLFLSLFVFLKLGLLDASKVKEKFIAFFLKGKSKEELQHKAKQYFQKRHKYLLRENAVEYVQSISQEDEKYMVSASMDIWLEPFAEYLELNLICTRAHWLNEKYSGKFLGKNCNGQEKAHRIQKEIALSKYDEIIAFGDTSGDKQMYNLATEFHHQYFHQ